MLRNHIERVAQSLLTSIGQSRREKISNKAA